MLDGVVRFPAEFAARYRAKGYWEDRALRDVFDETFSRYGDRIAIIDGGQSVTYTELNDRATRLALNLLDEGIKPLDRVVVQLPNAVEFVYLYFALQKIGCIPIMTSVEIAAYGDGIIERIENWWAQLDDKSCRQKVKTFYGTPPMHQLFERSTWHSAQHARQIIAVLERFGIEPDARLTADVLAGLPLPEGIWE